jgi:hypothetical protein
MKAGPLAARVEKCSGLVAAAFQSNMEMVL